jgi:hypothetical protein
LTRTIKNTFLIFWAAAVLFICIGSLINFHQHKIWGKPLLPQLLYAKRDKEKSLDILKSFHPELSGGLNPLPVSGFNAIQDKPSCLILDFTTLRFFDSNIPLLSQEFLFSCSLKAPPVA